MQPERDHHEEPLLGGKVTVGLVRVGDTVRRPRLPSSAFVEQLLRALELAGFVAAPRHLGVDERGRDVLSYIPGEVEPEWRRFADEQVAAGARLLRAFHDATRGLTLAGGSEVVCHGDPGPHNSIFRGGLPVALIDFDLAAPGPALDDVAYSIWGWCVSSNEDRGTPADQARQARLFADAYGLERPARAVDAILERQRWSADWWRERPELETDEAREEAVAWNLRERAYIEEHRALFLAALA